MNSLTDYCDKVTLKLIKGLIVSEHLSEMSHITCNGLCTSSINGTPVCCSLFSVQCTPTNTHSRDRKAGRIHQNSPVLYQTILIKGLLFLNLLHKMQLNEKLYMWLEGWHPYGTKPENVMGYDNVYNPKCFQHFLYFWKKNIVGLEHYFSLPNVRHWKW